MASTDGAMLNNLLTCERQIWLPNKAGQGDCLPSPAFAEYLDVGRELLSCQGGTQTLREQGCEPTTRVFKNSKSVEVHISPVTWLVFVVGSKISDIAVINTFHLCLRQQRTGLYIGGEADSLFRYS